MNDKIIAIDVDGTLVDYNDKPRQDVIDLFNWFQAHGWQVVVWSGGGKAYAQMWCDRLGLKPHRCDDKNKELQPDITVDDEPFMSLGKVNIKV